MGEMIGKNTKMLCHFPSLYLSPNPPHPSSQHTGGVKQGKHLIIVILRFWWQIWRLAKFLRRFLSHQAEQVVRVCVVIFFDFPTCEMCFWECPNVHPVCTFFSCNLQFHPGCVCHTAPNCASPVGWCLHSDSQLFDSSGRFGNFCSPRIQQVSEGVDGPSSNEQNTWY